MSISPRQTGPRNITLYLRIATASHRRRISGISRKLTPQDRWNINIVPDETRLLEILESDMPDMRPDGVISSVLYDPRVRKAVIGSDIPIIGIGFDEELRSRRSKAAAFVLNDNEGIGRMAADYLRSLGSFRSFAYIPDINTESQWNRLRQESFTKRLSESGTDCHVYVRPCADENDRRPLGAFLASLEKPAAVLAAWDGRAADVLNAAKAAGIDVPGQMAVLGVDDDKIICENTVPQLSSVRTDVESMGEKATVLLKKLMSGAKRKKSGPPETVICPVIGVVERDSTHPPAPAAHLVNRALAFIRSEAANGIGVEDVAAHLKVSRRLLDMRFREYCRNTVAETITERRLETVKRLLLKTSMPVKAAFVSAGFSDTTYPYRLFKSKTGLTPSRFRSGLHR